jgi:outer membrane immunogenic protein
MRHSFTKIILAAAVATVASTAIASAADMAVRAMPVKALPPAPVWSWSGCYVGLEAGGAWGRESVTATSPAVDAGLPITSVHPSGALGGGTIGCNYQTGQFVFGVENDISATGLSGTSGDHLPFATTFSHSVSSSWLDTLRARAGIAWDRSLFYVTGGAAFTDIKDSATGPGAGTVLGTTNRTGWTAGVGVEYMFTPQISAKVEYLYADFGTLHDPFDAVSGGVFVGANTHLTENIVRAGINYHFNWAGPVVARY